MREGSKSSKEAAENKAAGSKDEHHKYKFDLTRTFIKQAAAERAVLFPLSAILRHYPLQIEQLCSELQPFGFGFDVYAHMRVIIPSALCSCEFSPIVCHGNGSVFFVHTHTLFLFSLCS